MVVTRKTPVPMPPASRTPSTLSAPKVGKGKSSHSSPLSQDDGGSPVKTSSPNVKYVGPQFSDDAMFINSSPPRKSPKEKPKNKSRKKGSTKRERRPNTWLDFFSKVFLFGFLIYSLSVCPNAKDESAICRGLAEYRRLILEPYVITPFNNLLQHPSVSPYSTPIIENAKPILERSRKEWNDRVVPQWNGYVIPQWKKHVVPQWNTHVSPQIAVLDAKVDPYRRKVTEAYAKHVSPYVIYAQRVARKSQPYIVMTAARTYDSYQFSKPYIARTYEEAKRIPPFVNKYIIKPLAALRRQYVDPHVCKYYEEVKSIVLDKLASLGLEDQFKRFYPNTKATSEPTKSEVRTNVNKDTISSAASIAAASLHARQSSLFDNSASNTISSNTVASVNSVSTASKTLGDESTESVPGATYSPEPEDLTKSLESTQGTVSENIQQPSSSTYSTTSSSAPIDVPKAHRPSSPVPASASVDQELEDLLADLGLDLEETISVQPSVVPIIVKEESEEEKAAKQAARVAEVAEKRRELQARHTRWEEKLADAITKQTSVLKSTISEIRRSAAADLKVNLAIREAVEKLHSEAEKALRGTEAYFSKLKEGGKSRDEQSKLWDRVLKKVEVKFEERLQEVEEKVNKWYQDEVLSKEEQALIQGSDIIRTLADDAQADIGLDYAWLDDVTYLDWRRYHALLDKHKVWLEEANMLTNGTHEEPYPNPVVDTLEDLQSEVRDITVGFETRMRRIKREGDRTFSGGQNEEESASEPEVSALPIESKEDAVLQEVADAILGRSEDEIVEALGRAERYSHEEL